MDFTDRHPKVEENKDVTATGGATTRKCLKCQPLQHKCSDGRPGLTGAFFITSMTLA